MSALKVRPAAQGFGLLVEHADLSKAPKDDIDAYRSLLFENGVIFFRDQDLAPQDQIAIAERLGAIVVNRFFTPAPGFPKIAEVITEPDQDWVIGENWHTDHSYDPAPALGSMLYALETPPPGAGGDTCFAGMQCAYDALSDAMKERLAGLSARHESAHIFAPSQDLRLEEAEERGDAAYAKRAASYPSAVHPVVLRHPETGRKGLYVNPEFTTCIVGMEQAASDELLSELYEHILRPQFTYRFEWEPGSLAIWDNRSTWHKAMNDYRGHKRHMRRITLAGVPLGQVAA